MLGRYHALSSGRRQYLSFHITGDMPDVQALFVDRMDHAVCAMGEATIALIPHRKLLDLFEAMPSIGFAIWRETLIDAAIFREVITNNGGRQTKVRLAHFLCEQFYRARAAGAAESNSCALPLNKLKLLKHWDRRSRQLTAPCRLYAGKAGSRLRVAVYISAIRRVSLISATLVHPIFT